MNATDRKKLEKEMALWKDRLAGTNHKLSLARRAVESARKAKQMAQAKVERLGRQLARSTQPGPRRKAVAYALHYVGTTEHPAGTNRGPQVDVWEKAWGMIGQPWCGAFAGYACAQGGAKLTPRIVYTPYIYDDAAAGKNGLDKLVWTRSGGFKTKAHSGDLVLYDFGTSGIKHVGILVAPWNGTGPLQTVEGNTSFGDGSQDNGGCVARRQRDKSLVAAIVSVQWR